MVNMGELAAYHGSPAAAARMRKRHNAQRRLKLYGIAAILLAGMALAALLWSVVGKAGLALTESYVTLTVDLSDIEITAASSADEIGDVNYGKLAKSTLRATFPDVKSRGDKRALYGLISGGAPFELREALLADPSVLGGSYAFRFLASDDVDLYLKGAYGAFDDLPNAGVLTPSGTEGEITLSSTEPDFAAQLATVREALLGRAQTKRAEAGRQENGRLVLAARAEAEQDAAKRDRQLAQAAAYIAKRDALEAEAEDLEARARAESGEEALDESFPSTLIRINGGWVKATRLGPDRIEGEVVTPLTSDAPAAAGDWAMVVSELPEESRKISDQQAIWVETLRDAGAIDTVFNKRFFTAGDSRDAELAGIWGAVVGSFWTMLVTFVLAFPIGVMAAVYLEEFSPKNRLVSFIEVNINNLAAVPSIVFGLLGLAVFLQFFGVPRSAPLAGGMVMALMTLPTIIIASRVAIAAVPPSIRDAALGLGASRMQTTFHHVLPLAMPGVLTGAILGMARALGETAPLILIGMVAFIVDVPKGVTDSATVLPVQIFRWSDFPERAFEARTAAAICALLAFLIAMNGLAVFLRKQFERRW